MKSPSRIRLQRQFFWTLAERYETEGAKMPEGPDRDLMNAMAHEMALYVGCMDWVLGDDLTDED